MYEPDITILVILIVGPNTSIELKTKRVSPKNWTIQTNNADN